MIVKTDVGAGSPKIVRNNGQVGNQFESRPASGSAFQDLLSATSPAAQAQDDGAPVASLPTDTVFATRQISRSIEQPYEAFNGWNPALDPNSSEATRPDISGFGTLAPADDQAHAAQRELMPESTVPVEVWQQPDAARPPLDQASIPNTTLPFAPAIAQAAQGLGDEPPQKSPATIKVTETNLASTLRQPASQNAQETVATPTNVTIIGQEKHFGRETAGAAFALMTASSTISKAEVSRATPNLRADASRIASVEQKQSTFSALQMATDPQHLGGRSSMQTSNDQGIPPSIVAVPVSKEAEALPIVQQVMDAIKPQIAISQEAAATSATLGDLLSAPAEAEAGAHANAVRVLVVKLEPAELGMVTVRLTMKGDMLTVQLEASDRATAAMLESNRSVLIGDLAADGQRLGDLSVSLKAEPSTTQGTSATQSDSATQGGGPGLSLGGQSADSGGRGAGKFDGRADTQQRSTKASDEPNQASESVSRGPGVYL